MRALPLPQLTGALLLLAATSCTAPGVVIDVGYLQSTLDGDAALDPSTGLPSIDGAVDLQDGIGTDDGAGSLYARGEFDLTVPRLTVSAFRYADSGRGLLNADFGDITANTAVNSSSDIFNLKSALTFDIDIGPVRISPGVAVTLLDTDIAVQDTAAIFEEERFDEVLPVPLLFLQGEVDLHYVSAVVDVGALDIDVGEVDGTFVDVEALLRVHPLEHFEVFAGYRLISADVTGDLDGQPFTADLLLQGWMVGGGVRF